MNGVNAFFLKPPNLVKIVKKLTRQSYYINEFRNKKYKMKVWNYQNLKNLQYLEIYCLPDW